MPVYQYACTECGEQLEERQSFTDPALTVCPVCAGRLRKVLSAVGVVFKGSGFYRTDSRAASSNGSGASGDSGGKKAEAASGSGTKESSGSGSGSSDSGSAGTGSAGSASKGSEPKGASAAKSGDSKRPAATAH